MSPAVLKIVNTVPPLFQISKILLLASKISKMFFVVFTVEKQFVFVNLKLVRSR